MCLSNKVIGEKKFFVTYFGVTRKINEHIVKVVTRSRGFEYTFFSIDKDNTFTN